MYGGVRHYRTFSRHYRARFHKGETMKLFENIDIKNVITIVALLLWIGTTVYGLFFGEFTTVFDYFKEVFMMIVSFYLGTKVQKGEADDNE